MPMDDAAGSEGTGSGSDAERESKRRLHPRPASYAPIRCQCGHESYDHEGPDKACRQCSGCKAFFAFPRCL